MEHLSPEVVGDRTLLHIGAAPYHRPTTLLSKAPHLFRQARFADTCIAQEEHALRIALWSE